MRFFVSLVICLAFTSVSHGQVRRAVKESIEHLEDAFPKSKIAKKGAKLLSNHSSLIKWAENNRFLLKEKGLHIEILAKDNAVLGKVYKRKKSFKITDIPALIGRKKVNPLLDADLFPNSIYQVESSVFKTDRLGRVISAEIKSIPSSVTNRAAVKGANEQAKALAKNGIRGIDHGGHLIAHSLGGNSGAINIVAQYAKLNTGKFASVESLVRNNRKFIKNYKVEAIYKGSSQRPFSFKQRFEFRGKLKELSRLKKKNADFGFIKSTDSNGHSFYDCFIFHRNPVK